MHGHHAMMHEPKCCGMLCCAVQYSAALQTNEELQHMYGVRLVLMVSQTDQDYMTRATLLTMSTLTKPSKRLCYLHA